MSLFRDAAAFYTGLGWMVFPLAAGSKVPAIRKGQGFKQATDDYDTITEWARKFPDANVGVATGEVSGITVVDIDPRNGGHETIAKLAAENYLLPWVPEARTGNNGRHLFFAYHPEVQASKNRLGQGIDIKTDGGYVVGVPSIIKPSEAGPGGTYRWVIEPDGGPLPPMPAWLVEKLRPRAAPATNGHTFERTQSSVYYERALEGMAAKLATAGKGSRNNLLNWAAYRAGLLVKQGVLSESHVISRLTQAGLACGLIGKDIEATIKSGLRGAMMKG